MVLEVVQLTCMAHITQLVHMAYMAQLVYTAECVMCANFHGVEIWHTRLAHTTLSVR